MTVDSGAQEHPAEEGSAQEQGLLELAAGVVVDPARTLRIVTSAAPVGMAIFLTVLLSLLSSGASAAQVAFGHMQSTFGGPQGPFGDLGLSRPLLIAGMLILGPLFSLLGLAIGTAILKLSSLALGGKGSYPSLFTGLAFANVPSIFGIPLQLLPLALGQAGQMFSGLLNMALAIWIIFLAVIAVREANRFTTGRAVAAVLIPIAIIFALVFVLILFFFAAFLQSGVVGA